MYIFVNIHDRVSALHLMAASYKCSRIIGYEVSEKSILSFSYVKNKNKKGFHTIET